MNNRLLKIHEKARQATPAGTDRLAGQAAALIRDRAAALAELVGRNPGEALQFAFPEELLTELGATFPGSAGLLESHGAWSGPFQEWIEDTAGMKTHRSMRRLKAGQQWLDVRFAGPEPEGLSSGGTLLVKGVRVGTMLAVSSANVPASDLGIRSEAVKSAPAAVAGASCSTTGVQNTAVLLATFPGVALPSGLTNQSVYDMFFGTAGPSLSGYWKEVSYGQTTASGNVFGVYTLSGSYACSNMTQFITDAVTAAANAGVDFRNYTRVFILFPGLSPSCGWAGLSSIGCYNLSTGAGTFSLSTSALVWNSVSPASDGVALAAHEGGHQLGMAHARLRTFGTQPLGPLGAAGTLVEYGDHFSSMGYPNFGHYAAGHKAEILNWLRSGANYQVVQSSGTYTLQPYEASPAGLDALKIQRGTGNNAWLWLEYRQPTGVYDSTLPAQGFSGALIHYQDPLTGPQTDLLDMTAPSPYSDNPALAAGGTWTDPYSNLSLSVVSAGSNGLTVNVNYGTAPCTPANPSLALAPLNPSIYAGASTTYDVSVTNNDSSGCPSTTLAVSSAKPSGWPSSFSPVSVTLTPGQSAVVRMTKTAPAGTAPGTYPVDASAAQGSSTGSATANITVMSAPGLNVNVSVPAQSYTRRSTVPITATVLNGGTAVGSATVKFILTVPGGGSVTQTAATNTKGAATWNYKLNQKSAAGTYSVTAQATAGAQTGTSNTASFTVQ